MLFAASKHFRPLNAEHNSMQRPSNDTRTMCQKISRPTDFKALKVYKKKEERSLQRKSSEITFIER